jgi:hypothetical protein
MSTTHCAYRIGPPLALWFRRSSVLELIARRGHRIRNKTFPYNNCDESRFGLLRVHTLEFDHDFEPSHVEAALAANPSLTHARFHHVLAFEEAYPELLDGDAIIAGLGTCFRGLVSVRKASVRRDIMIALGAVIRRHRNVEISFWDDPFPKTSTILLAQK